MEHHPVAQTGPRRRRPHDARRTRRSILDAARTIFADKGYSGANVSEIVLRADTTKPMVYYHFKSKEGLFAAVLEDVYSGMREIERSLDLSTGSATEGLRRLVEVTFDYHAAHPEWVRLISIANIHDAQHIVGSPSIASPNAAIIEITGDLLERGRRTGEFRGDVDPLHLHLLICSFSFYRVSNRHTWAIIFRRDLSVPEDVAVQRAMLTEAVLHYVAPATPLLKAAE